ncbi:MAG: sugar phosphate isomerase/epimerase [Clostridia bacterium]|nr:sugar phosphate isomerase/epimerase [Clostridia bacterium]
MQKTKLGISLKNSYPLPVKEVIKIIAQSGFDALSPVNKNGTDITEVVNTAKEYGIILQSLHTPSSRSVDMWKGDKECNALGMAQMTESLELCHKYEIPIMVAHIWQGYEPVDIPKEAGIENHGRLIEKAKEYGVKIAYENTEGEDYLFALLEHFKNNNTVGFCWDSGHELCYNSGKDLLKKFGDQLIMTHLNDNNGCSDPKGKLSWLDDLHLLPGDGICDWNYNIERLKKAKRQDILNFELSIESKPNQHENDKYCEMPLEEYFSTVYNIACNLRDEYDLS